MHGPHDAPRGPSSVRARVAQAVYGGLLVAVALRFATDHAPAQLGHHIVAVAALVGLGIGGQLASHELRARVTHVFDMDLGVMLVAVALAGPLAAVLVVATPELLNAARRRRTFPRLGLLADLVSIAATALAGSAVLAVSTTAGAPIRAVMLFAAGLAMLVVNYGSARLLLAVIRDGAAPLTLIRDELVALLPLELATIAIGVVSALLVPDVGLLALAAFLAVIYVPQLAVSELLRAPSVARLSVDAAARVYRAALADEIRLDGARRLVHLVDALAERRPLTDSVPRPPDAVRDALLVTICRTRAPTQREFSAPPRAQVVLVARRWAELTARCTPALSHHEALVELHGSGLCHDAPLALAAAGLIIEREQRLTEHIAGVPRLHRTPLPRALRRGMLPVALARLAA